MSQESGLLPFWPSWNRPLALCVALLVGTLMPVSGMVRDGAGMTAHAETPTPAPTLGWMQTPDGGKVRYARWDTPAQLPRGTVVLFTGRGEVIEKYQEVATEWGQRGFQAFSMDWRGQGLSSRFLENRHKGYVPDYSVWVGDATQFMRTVVEPALAPSPGTVPRPLVLMAHSMGGQVALRYLIRDPHRFSAVILSSPMTDVNTGSWPRFVVEMVSRTANGIGFSESYAFGQHDYDPSTDAVFEGNPLSHDPVRFRRLSDLYRNNPDMALGGVTFGWLAASFHAAALTMVPGALDSVMAPVLLFSSPGDRLVDAETHPTLCEKMRHCALVRLPGAGHEPLMETDAIRSTVWKEIDAFLARTLGSVKSAPN